MLVILSDVPITMDFAVDPPEPAVPVLLPSSSSPPQADRTSDEAAMTAVAATMELLVRGAERIRYLLGTALGGRGAGRVGPCTGGQRCLWSFTYQEFGLVLDLKPVTFTSHPCRQVRNGRGQSTLACGNQAR